MQTFAASCFILTIAFTLTACGDSASSANGGSGGAGGVGGSGGSGAAGGSGGTAGSGGCPGVVEGPATWICECANEGNYATTSCAANECDGQTACDDACGNNGPATGFETATFVSGTTCDTICGFVNECCAACDVYFWCGVDFGETPADAETRLACKAENAAGWSCDQNGEARYDGPATCN